MPPTSTVYDLDSPSLSVQVFLKQPTNVARALTALTWQRYVADKIFLRGSAESVAGGTARYERAETIFLDRAAAKRAPRASFRRAGSDEDVRTAIAQEYGLEVPIPFRTIRRNQRDVLGRNLRKLANSIVDAVDDVAINLILTDSDVQTTGASADWSTGSTDIIKDIAGARKAIREQNQGYEADTLILNEAQALDIITDADLRDAMPRESMVNPAMTGMIAPFMGFRQVLVTNTLTAGKVIVMDSRFGGTIADEELDPIEDYVAFSPGGEFRPIQTKVYKSQETDEIIVRGMRTPVMYLTDPKAIFVLTSA